MENKIYAVFLDIDNTLLCDGIIPPINIDTINKVREAGSYVFLNTARSYGCIPKHLLEEVPLDGVVAGIGTDLRFRNKQIFSKIIPHEEVKALAAYFMGDPREIGFEGEDAVIWINPDDGRNAEFLLHSPDDFDTVYKDFRISKMYIRGQLTPAENELFGKTNILFQHEQYAEFVQKGFGKAWGMEYMCNYLSVPKENTIAMGDSANDSDMLHAAGISVAMGNAIREIKEMCDFVSCNAKDGGVATALKKYILVNL